MARLLKTNAAAGVEDYFHVEAVLRVFIRVARATVACNITVEQGGGGLPDVALQSRTSHRVDMGKGPSMSEPEPPKYDRFHPPPKRVQAESPDDHFDDEQAERRHNPYQAPQAVTRRVSRELHRLPPRYIFLLRRFQRSAIVLGVYWMLQAAIPMPYLIDLFLHSRPRDSSAAYAGSFLLIAALVLVYLVCGFFACHRQVWAIRTGWGFCCYGLAHSIFTGNPLGIVVSGIGFVLAIHNLYLAHGLQSLGIRPDAPI